MASNDRTKNEYIFPQLVYVSRMLGSGKVSMDEFKKVLAEDLEEYGHTGEYSLPVDFEEQLHSVLNKSGWLIFEFPKIRQQQHDAAVIRREEKLALRKAEIEKRKAKKK